MDYRGHAHDGHDGREHRADHAQTKLEPHQRGLRQQQRKLDHDDGDQNPAETAKTDDDGQRQQMRVAQPSRQPSRSK